MPTQAPVTAEAVEIPKAPEASPPAEKAVAPEPAAVAQEAVVEYGGAEQLIGNKAVLMRL
ncbi:MAG: hypothetical protein U0946_03170 [Patescibacteria group bacterium]|nr:hypothetical protein [Patescibacteria group bacterium]